MAQINKPHEADSLIRVEVAGSTAESVRANLLGLLSTGVSLEPFVLNTAGSLHIQNAQNTAASVNAENVKPDEKETQERDEHSYSAECDELQKQLEEALGKLEDEYAKVATLQKTVTKLNTQLKDAENGGEKSHKAFLEEQKRADAAEARIKELETQLKAAGGKPAPAAQEDNATNDAEADAALNKPDAAETKPADDGKAKPGARTNRTTRNVSKPAEETAEHKALRETITNDLLDLGGLAEKNAQVATDVEEILTKYGVANGADLTTEQLEDAAADIGEIIKVYFRE